LSRGFATEQLVADDVATRKAYLSSVVDATIVSENKIRIVGSNVHFRTQRATRTEGS
jgi:hypothetical protein